MQPKLNQNPAEFRNLLEIFATQKPCRILEIGTYEGGSLYYWLINAALFGCPKKIKIGSIDDQHVNEKYYEEWTGGEIKPLLFKGKSQTEEAIDFAKQLCPIDWLFIDGGHSYEEVLFDWTNYGSLVKPGGIISFHDIAKTDPYIGDDGRTFPVEVHRLWNEIKHGFNYLEIIEPHDEWGSGPGIGVIYK